MNYPLMKTPFEFIPFDDMNKSQADRYFQWFMIEKDNRIKQLQMYINEKTNDLLILDKTPESLISLWEWFEHEIEWEEKTANDLQRELIGRPEWIHQELKKKHKKDDYSY